MKDVAVSCDFGVESLQRSLKILLGIRKVNSINDKKKGDQVLKAIVSDISDSELDVIFKHKNASEKEVIKELFPYLSEDEVLAHCNAFRENLIIYAAFALCGARQNGMPLSEDKARFISRGIVTKLSEKESKRIQELSLIFL
jgi:hypothetical protein